MATNPFAVDAGNDFTAGLSGLSATMANIRQSRVVEAERQRQIAAEEAQKERQAQATAAAQQAFKNGDPAEMAQVSLQFPEIGENLRKTIGLDDERKNKEAGEFARRLLTATPEQRASIYEERINSLQKEGRDPSHTLQSYRDYQNNPNGELQALETVWAATDPKGYTVIADQHKAAQRAALEEQKQRREDMRFERAEAGRNQRAYARAAATASGSASDKRTAHQKDFEQYQELVKTDPEAAKAFGQASGFVSKEGRELAPGVQTRLAKTIDAAVGAENNIVRYNSLADQMESAEFSGGVTGGMSEKLKELTGEQDAVTALRKAAYQARATQAMANLPPGAASDPDVRIAFQPMPSDNASPKEWATWFRGQAKAQQINAEFQNFKADYISDTGSERGMLKAWKEQGNGGAKAKSAPAPAAQSSDGWEIIQ